MHEHSFLLLRDVGEGNDIFIRFECLYITEPGR